MGMNIGTGGGNSEAEPIMDINTTPLIDVMLVLIIMLIITIPIQLHSVNLEMPVGTPPTQEKPLEVRVDIDRLGQIYWDGVVVDRVTLDNNMVEAAKRNPQPNVLVRPDKAARYDNVAYVIANTQRRGLTKLAIIGSEQYR
ncbi:MAG: biopolymer transporter ExbD [Gammaproteobacteria bacterium]|nr:biopolymer transporter ExbD [Gammaproteobacteria bacterium]